MRTRSTTALLAAAVAALAPRGAAAFDYAGQLGIGYDRTESWMGTPAQYSLVPRLQLNGDLAARGSVFDPGVVDWDGRVGYNDIRSTYGSASDKTTALTYGAHVGVLQTRSSRATLTADAFRSVTDYSRDAEAVRTTGTSVANGYGASALAAPPGLPSLTSRFTYRDVLNSGLGRPDTTELTRRLELGSRFGQPGLDTELNYALQWDEGSLVPSNYTSQEVSASATANPAQNLTAHLTANHYERLPTALGSLNPRYQNTGFDGYLTWQESASRVVGQYRYNHASATDPSLVLREQAANSLTTSYARRTSTEWEWVASASGSYSDNRVGPSQSYAAGQSVGLGANWVRRALGASFGGQLGALEPETGATQLAFGANASGRAAWNLPHQVLSASYTVNYATNLDARPGWSTSQTATATLSANPAPFLSWSASVQASGARGGGGPFGATAQRSVLATGEVRYRRTATRLDLGATDAATGALSNPFSDGLFIPSGYNTRSRFAGLTMSVPLAVRLSLTGFTKYTILSGPGTPDQREALLGGSLRYALGYWTFSLDERYTVGGTTAFDRRINELFVRLSRSFGG